MRSFRTIVPEDVVGDQPTDDCLVQIHNIWIPCFVASQKHGWYCVVFGGSWNEQGEEQVTPAEYYVRAEDILMRIH